MFGAKIYGAVSTVVSASTLAASVMPKTAVPPTMVPFIGPVPVFAVGVGFFTVLLVREITRASDKYKLWRYNAAVTGLAIVGTVTFIIDHQVGAGNAFWVGGSFGAAGAGTVSVMRSKIFTAILSGIRSGFLKGMASPPNDGGTKSE